MVPMLHCGIHKVSHNGCSGANTFRLLIIIDSNYNNVNFSMKQLDNIIISAIIANKGGCGYEHF